MTTVNIGYVQEHLTELLDLISGGESFLIEREGQPLATMTPPNGADSARPLRKIGFMDGQFNIPDDIKAMDREEIEHLFEGRL